MSRAELRNRLGSKGCWDERSLLRSGLGEPNANGTPARCRQTPGLSLRRTYPQPQTLNRISLGHEMRPRVIAYPAARHRAPITNRPP